LARNSLNGLAFRLRALAARPVDATLADGELLERYVTACDNAAFEALFRRHAAMVLAVCRRVTNNSDDAEDAFQATFLVLVQKAATIRPRHMVGNWLYGVAYRAASKARARTIRHRTRERPLNPLTPPVTLATGLWDDVLPLLDRELCALPDKYRLPLVLCDLEGRTRKAAARTLDWPEGTVAWRLAQGRALLARRLTRHGLPVSGSVLAALLAQNAASASLPPALASAGLAGLIMHAAAARAAACAISTPVAALAHGVMKTMLISKLKVVSIAVMLLAALTLSGSLLVSAPADQGDGAAAATPRGEPARPAAVPAGKVAGTAKPVSPREINEKEAEARALRVLEKLDPRDVFREGDRPDGPIVTIHVPGSACSDADLKEIGLLPKLRFLNITGTRITNDGLAPLEAMKELRILKLQECKLSDEGLAHLAGLTELTKLYLSKTLITDAGLARLAGLKNLECLFLDRTGITDAGLDHLVELKNLTVLGVQGTRVSNKGVAKLAKALPRLHIIQ
jgi:RNA polymerase sigma factor (sigma-70 family)